MYSHVAYLYRLEGELQDGVITHCVIDGGVSLYRHSEFVLIIINIYALSDKFN
jgi:hypothetical protein